MRAPDCADGRRMARDVEPIVDCGADLAALDRRVAETVVPGDQENDARVSANGAFQRPVDRRPGPIEAHAMEVERDVGLNIARAKAAIPTAVERTAWRS